MITSHRELLELAAAAVGIKYEGFDEDRGCDIWWLPDLSRFDSWNPLEDDGDALRLAVKLKINLKFTDTATYAMQSGPRIGTADGSLERCHRLAIVRTAATIGAAVQGA